MSAAALIPLGNLYRMLCWGWRHPDAAALGVGELDRFERIDDFFGVLIAAAIRGVVRRGLARGYRELEEDLRAPRGKLLVSQTVKRQLRLRGRIHCSVEDLVADIVPNRILKAALSRLEHRVSAELRAPIRALKATLHDVCDVPLSALTVVLIGRHPCETRARASACRIAMSSRSQLSVGEIGHDAETRSRCQACWTLPRGCCEVSRLTQRTGRTQPTECRRGVAPLRHSQPMSKRLARTSRAIHSRSAHFDTESIRSRSSWSASTRANFAADACCSTAASSEDCMSSSTAEGAGLGADRVSISIPSFVPTTTSRRHSS